MRTKHGFLLALTGVAGLIVGFLPGSTAYAAGDMSPPPFPPMLSPSPVGQNWNFFLGTASDPDGGSLSPGDFAVSIDWGDPSPDVTSGDVNHMGPGDTNWNVSGSHTYAAEGTYTIGVSVTNSAGDSASWTVQANVSHLFNPCSGGPGGVCAQSLSAVEGHAASGVVGIFGDTNTSASASDFSASLNWTGADGYSSLDTNATIVKDGADSTSTVSYFYVQGSHIFPEWAPPQCNGPCFGNPPNFGVQVSVGDNLGATLNQSNGGGIGNGVYVLEGALNPASVSAVSTRARAAFSQALATFTDGDPGGMSTDYQATINWGDGATKKCPTCTDITTGTVTGTGGGPFTITGGHRYTSRGSYTIIITVAEADNPATQVSFNDFATVK